MYQHNQEGKNMRSLEQRKYALHFPAGEGRTEEAHAGEADINQIMARAKRGEHEDYANKHEPRYGDATGPQYLEANILIAAANSMFEELPSGLRSRFNHNPAQFLEFVQNPGNEEELIQLKLKNPKPKTEAETLPESNKKPSEKTTEDPSEEKKGETK